MSHTPYPFQQEAVDKLHKQKSRLVGDDMGLGKTDVGIWLDKRNRFDAHDEALKTLIVCPKSVISAWEEALDREAPNTRVYVIDPKNRTPFVRAASDERKFGYFLCHWEALRLMPELRSVHWFHIIGDEVHRAKNREAKQTKALKALRTEYKTGLSGTPADNKPDDLWSILNWLWPTYYRSYWRFVGHYCEQTRMPGGYVKITGVVNASSLHAEMRPWFVRRLKEDVLKELPDKYYTNIWVDLSPTQRRSYNEMRSEMIAWLGKQDQERPLVAPVVIAQLVRLQQFALASAEITGYVQKVVKLADGTKDLVTVPEVKMIDPSSKLDALMELLDNTSLDTEPVVVFSQFRGSIRLLEERCQKAGYKLVTLTGGTSQAERASNIRDFQEGRAHVFAGTIAAGGVGITLTRASTVVFLDRAWSPSVNRQAEDRLHRIGQKNAVQVIDIMARKTIDLGRRQQIERKWTWLQQILGD